MNNVIEAKQFHFYASSVGEWKVSTDIEALIKSMKRSRLSFTLWKVPGDKTATYDIRYFTPMVAGRVYLGHYLLNGRKWIAVSRETAGSI